MFQSLKSHEPEFVSELVRSRQKRAPSGAFKLSQMYVLKREHSHCNHSNHNYTKTILNQVP